MHRHYGNFDLSTLLPIVGGALSPFISQGLANNYSTIEIRTAVSPPVVVSVADLLDNKAPPSPVAKFLQPTVILTDKAGNKNVIAPYGVSEGSTGGLLAIAGLLGLVFFAGRLSAR